MGEVLKTITPIHFSNPANGEFQVRLFGADSNLTQFAGVALMLEELAQQHISERNRSNLPEIQTIGNSPEPEPNNAGYSLEPDRKHWHSYFALAGKLQSNFINWEAGLDFGYHYYWNQMGLSSTINFLAVLKAASIGNNCGAIII